MAVAMVRLSSLLIPAAAAFMLTGCGADTVNYPSLARRPAERISGTSPVVIPDPAATEIPAPPSPELTARLAQLLDTARTANTLFKARETKAEALTNAAAGAPVASEGWSVATIALADLESARSNAMIALADLDALYAAARVSGGEANAINLARDQVIALVGGQDRALMALRSKLAN